MASRQRYQNGSLLNQRRADGSSEWILRYRVTLPDGRRVQRQAVVGATEQYKTESQANKAADQLRITINNATPATQVPTVAQVAQHFKDVELTESDTRRAWSTKENYKEMLNLFILPRWETTRVMDVKSVAVEGWLAMLLSTKTGKPLENGTKQRIRNIFSVLFTHAQRYEFVPQGHNPISLVRQTGKRSCIPDILEPWEMNAIWLDSSLRERAAISIEYGNGLRISEAFALKWRDINSSQGTALVTKGIVNGHLGEVKTEVSRKLVPLHAYQLQDLAAWRAVSPYNGDDDWVFASDRNHGLKPYWPHMILRRHIRRTAKKLGIVKKIGWHTFRRTYASLLKANGEDVKVVQELCRHANPSTTLTLYAQAFTKDARRAQGKVVEMVRKASKPEESPVSEHVESLNVPYCAPTKDNISR
ncbi:MAG TPA: site-specific integrase [Terriglobales bacterium]